MPVVEIVIGNEINRRKAIGYTIVLAPVPSAGPRSPVVLALDEGLQDSERVGGSLKEQIGAVAWLLQPVRLSTQHIEDARVTLVKLMRYFVSCCHLD